MNRLNGPATLTYDDGSTIDGEARLTSIEPAGRGFIGTFKSKQAFGADPVKKLPVLEVEGIRFRVVVSRLNLDGVATIETSGPPIK